MSEERRAQLLGAVDFTDADAARLRALLPHIESDLPAIADRFCGALECDPVGGSHLLDLEQRAWLRARVIVWMGSRIGGTPLPPVVGESLGRRHALLGLPPYCMFLSVNAVRVAIQDRIFDLLPPDDARATGRSLDKLLDVELAVFVTQFQLASEEKLFDNERRAVGDRLVAMQMLGAGLAHEIRNPLNAARLQLELLERRLRKPTTNRETLLEPSRCARDELVRLATLLDDFLVFAEPETLRLSVEDVVQLAHTVVAAEQDASADKHVTIELEAPPRTLARVDLAKLREVVRNLVRNAIEAAPPDGHVQINVVERDTTVEIAISDDGPGIPETIRHRIHEPFFSTKHGTGLGLSIAHSLLRMQRGTLELSTSADGTRFVISVPRAMEPST